MALAFPSACPQHLTSYAALVDKSTSHILVHTQFFIVILVAKNHLHLVFRCHDRGQNEAPLPQHNGIKIYISFWKQLIRKPQHKNVRYKELINNSNDLGSLQLNVRGGKNLTVKNMRSSTVLASSCFIYSFIVILVGKSIISQTAPFIPPFHPHEQKDMAAPH